MVKRSDSLRTERAADAPRWFPEMETSEGYTEYLMTLTWDDCEMVVVVVVAHFSVIGR